MVGIVSIVLCWVPILNNIFIFIGIVGLGLGIAGIVITKKKQATRSGFGMAVAGTILSIVAIIGVFATQALYVKAVDTAVNKLSSPSITSAQSGSTDTSSTGSAQESSDSSSDSGIVIHIESLKPAGNDYEGKPTVMLTYTVTNNSDKNFSVMTLSAKAFQNGTSLGDFVIYRDNPEGYDTQSKMQDIQPGATGTVTEAFNLQDETTPVHVEIEDSFDFSGKSQPVTQDFPLQ